MDTTVLNKIDGLLEIGAAFALLGALDDLEAVTSQVIQHNAARMRHRDVRAWLVGTRREPNDARLGIVSIAPAVRIRRRLAAGEEVPASDVSRAIATMQRAMTRAKERATLHAERNRAAA